MKTLMIILCKLHDREKFIDGYSKAVGPLVPKFGGEYLMAGPGAISLEGTLEGYTSVAISKWPNREAALNFWHSEEYTQAKKLREGIADCEVTLVDIPG